MANRRAVEQLLKRVHQGAVSVECISPDRFGYSGERVYRSSDGWHIHLQVFENEWVGVGRLQSPDGQVLEAGGYGSAPPAAVQWQVWGVAARGNPCSECGRSDRKLQVDPGGTLRCWACHRLAMTEQFGPPEPIFMTVRGQVEGFAHLPGVRHHGDCYLLFESSEDSEHYRLPYQEGQIVRCRLHHWSPEESSLMADGLCDCPLAKAP